MAEKLTAAQFGVLSLLAEQCVDFGCLNFKTIKFHTGFDVKIVRRTCRSLKRKGLAEFHNGLWTEDGEPAGSGYCASPAGRAALSEGEG